MRTVVVILLAVTVLLATGIEVLAQSRSGRDVNVRYREYRVHVNLKPRILIIEHQDGATYMQWYSNSAFEPKMQFLGEEIYENGAKTSDTFKEND